MREKMQRAIAFSLSSFALVTFSIAVTPSPAHAIGPATFFVGLCKTMANMAMEPVEILMLPWELADHSDHTPSVNTDSSKAGAPASTTTTTTTTTTTK